MNAQQQDIAHHEQNRDEKYYKHLEKKTILRLALTYLIPLIVLIVYFQLQYNNLMTESHTLHLQAIAENQAKTLDLFLRERVVNIVNLIDDPRIEIPPNTVRMHGYLEKLKRDSEAFIDVGFFDSLGIQIAYDGPFPLLQRQDYSHEPWFMKLKKSNERSIITDIYLGFRKEPHFTIGVNRYIGNDYCVLRATLDPTRIYKYITEIEGTSEVDISIINQDGVYQFVHPRLGKLLDKSPLYPTKLVNLGASKGKLNGSETIFAFCWLNEAPWAVIVQKAVKTDGDLLFGMQINLIIFSTFIILLLFTIIIFRAKKMVQIEKEKNIAQEEKEIVELQLEHASKLASVGELASGIAHEINNPLAIIASEVGLIKDYMSPEFRKQISDEKLLERLDNIHNAAFRCRDITRKLLSFVRQTDFKLEKQNLNEVIKDLVEAFYEREMAVSNIDIVSRLAPDLPTLITDANLIRQVLLNLINNAIDAIAPPGRITITTLHNNYRISVSIEDTGKGITKDQMEKIFLPFYTTKEVGKGTGLGLSVSYGIIKNLGGKIEVESIPGKGSKFTIIFPKN